MLSEMRKYLIILLILFVSFVGCSNESNTTKYSGLPDNFITRFDKLFLSKEPIRYQDNMLLLEKIEVNKLTLSEKKIVRKKIKEFLLSNTFETRTFTKDSILPGLTSPFAMLRLKSVQILANVGKKEDIDFLDSLVIDKKSEHPIFNQELEKAKEKLKNR